jgi:multiple sugar transport system substrate-binding protein
MKRRTFLKGTAAAGAMAAAGPFVHVKANAYTSVPEPGPDELRIIESAKKLKKNVDLSFIAWGGHSKGEMVELAAAFKKATGIGLGKPIDIGFPQLSTRAMAEMVSRSGKIDLLHVHSDTVPTLYTGGLAAPLDDYMESAKFDYSSVGTFVEMSQIEGKTIGLVTDGNCHTYFVRKDLLENPDHQKRFADKYGYPLKFATTWKEYLDQGAYFGSDPNKMTGFGNLRARRWGFWWFFINYYNHGLFPFNDDLSLNFDNDTAEAALGAYLAEKKYVQKDLDNWGTSQMWLLLSGAKGYQSIYWGGVLPVVENPKKSKSAGKWAHGAVPANVLPNGRRIARTCAAGPPLVVVNNFGKNKDAAAHLAMWWTSRRNSTYIVGGSISTVHDPWRKEHFTDPEVRKGYTPAGTDAIYLNQQINSPMVRTTGAAEFNDTLDKNISNAWLGLVKPRAALKAIEKDWHKIIRRVGKSRMKKDVKAYRNAMPKVDVPKVG